MLSPKRTKFRKAHKGRIYGMAKGGTQLNFGAYGLKAVTPERVTASDRSRAPAITRHLRRAGRVWIRIFPDVRYHRAAEVRMGKGGVTRILVARLAWPDLFEIDGGRDLAQQALMLLPPNCPSIHVLCRSATLIKGEALGNC